MDEMHLNRTISVTPQGGLLINNREVDFDMFLIEEEAISLLEEELMEGRQNYDYPDDEEYAERDEINLIFDDDSFSEDDISFEGGYFDISNDDFDFNY